MNDIDTGREFVAIRHPVTEQTCQVRRSVFEAVWRKRDWELLDEEGEPIPNPEVEEEPVEDPDTPEDPSEES